MEYFGAGAHDAGPQRVSDRNVRNTDDDNSQPNERTQKVSDSYFRQLSICVGFDRRLQ